MKMNSVNPSSVKETNSVGKSFEFGIKDAGMVAELLRSKLYSYPIRTLVQEYLSNGRDAQREAKCENRPLDVVLPTKSAPTFKVRDYGPGLSEDRIKDVFIYYGSSTKNGDNEQTGGFGIGAKSAWAYTDSFVIVSYVDGTATHYLAHLGKSKQGTLEVLKSHKTEEENGVEIQIAVRPEDYNEFANAVFRATFFWKTRPTIQNSEQFENESCFKDYTPVFQNKDFAIFRNEKLNFINEGSNRYLYNSGDCLAVVDGIPYALSENLGGDSFSKLKAFLNYDYSIVLFFKTGILELNAGREEIAESESSKRAISKICNDALSSVYSTVKLSLESSTSIKDFFGTYKKFNSCLRIYNNSYKFSNGPEVIWIKGGKIESKTFDSVQRQRFTKKMVRRGNGKFRICKDFPKEISPNFSHLIYVNEDIGPNKAAAKVKNFISNLPSNEECYLLTPEVLGENESFYTSAGAIPTSTLTIAVNNPVVSGVTGVKSKSSGPKIKPNYQMIGINKITSSGSYYYREAQISHETIDASALSPKDKFVYYTASQFEEIKANKRGLNHIANFFKSQGLTLCYLSSRSQDWASKYSNFVKLDDYIQTLSAKELADIQNLAMYSILNEIIKDNEYNCGTDSQYVKDFTFRAMNSSDISSELKDKNLKIAFSRFYSLKKVHKDCNSEKSVVIPSEILDLLYKKDSSLKDFKEIYENFYKYLSKNYPLALNSISDGDNQDNEVVKELVYYFNAKYKSI